MTVTIDSVASAFPPNSYTQEEVAKLLGVQNPVVLKLLRAPHIERRNLSFDALPGSSCLPQEGLPELHKRFLDGVHGFGMDAAREALQRAQVRPEAIRVIVTVTSSGMALPGLSAIAMKQLGINTKAHRVDICGMGCNAGMSGLRTLSQYLSSMPAGTKGLLLCCEVNSAIYLRDESVGAGIVNSLFGDGAVAIVVSADPSGEVAPLTQIVGPRSLQVNNPDNTPRLSLADFETHTFLEYFDDMRYEVDEAQGLYNFKLSKRIPAAVAVAVKEPVLELLARHKLCPADVAHWIVHSGGAAVIDGITRGLGLREDDLRHTVSVLRDYGNIASGSFLVSFERLLQEHRAALGERTIRIGDIAVLIAMGPGTTVEVGLGVFH